MILDGIMLLWFVEVALSVAFVAIDIRRTPESPVLKWGFVIVTLFTGPIGLVLYGHSRAATGTQLSAGPTVPV